ncbi:sigma-70 family RNA polymerase sigma factor [Porticoccaceae bacterium]|nr:sigma-70 family RNA polymerase sigma factor [Porticoccaceae bacterium]
MDEQGNQPSRETSGSITEAFIKHQTFLKRFISRFLTRPQDIEDAAQEAFLKAFAAEQKHEVHAPKSFLFQIAKNVALQELTKKSNMITDYIEDLADTAISYEGRTLEDVFAGEQRMALFCKAAATLPPQCRRAFIMRKVYGMSQKEIAKELGITISTVEKHHTTGLKRCSEMMRKLGDTEIKQPAAATSLQDQPLPVSQEKRC